jgi:hypothetical protein
MKHRLIRVFALTILISTATFATTAPQADAKPVSALPCAKWHNALRKHGLPVKVFAPIMWRESKCQTKAVGWNYRKGMSHRDCKLSHARTYRKCKAVKSYDVGLLQINSSWKSLTAKVCKAKYGKMLVLQKPDCNLKVAAVLYNDGKGLVNWQGTSSRMSQKK